MSAYSDAVLALSPAGYWRLGEPGGGVAIDQRWANHGTYDNTPTMAAAGALARDVDTAVAFARASSERVSLPVAAALHPGDTLSIAFWAKRASLSAGNTHHVWDNGAGDAEVFFGFDDKLYFGRAGIATLFRSDDLFQDLTAYHQIVVTKAGASIAAYRDGAPITGTVLNSTLVPSGLASRIAGTISGANFYDGTLDEVAIFPAALSAAQVATLYQVGTDPAVLDMDGIAAALAARFAPAQVVPPAGLTNVRKATADLPQALNAMPVVLVFPEAGALDTGNGTRAGLHRFVVRFYFGEARNLARETNACRKWLPVLLGQLGTGGAVQLGGLVDNCEVADWRIGRLPHASQTYSGIELGVNVTTSEGWLPT